MEQKHLDLAVEFANYAIREREKLEEIAEREIMITHEIYSTYAPDTDITFIMKDTIGDEGVISTEVIGFYYGEPSTDLNMEYSGKLKAEF